MALSFGALTLHPRSLKPLCMVSNLPAQSPHQSAQLAARAAFAVATVSMSTGLTDAIQYEISVRVLK